MKTICKFNILLFLLLCSTLLSCSFSKVENKRIETSVQKSLPTNTQSGIQNDELQKQKGLSTNEISLLLSEGQNCKTKCFLGIEPGVTTLSEALTIFKNIQAPLEKSTEDSKNSVYETRILVEDQSYVSILITFSGNIVQNIMGDIAQSDKNQNYSSNFDDYSTFPSTWVAYTIKNIFLKYGNPDDIRIFSDEHSEETDDIIPSPYSVFFYFNSKDIIFQYKFAQNDQSKKDMKFCPNVDRFLELTIWIGKNPINPPPLSKYLEKASDSYIQSIYANNNSESDLAIQCISK